MKYALTPEEMKQADSTAINQYGIPGEILMENAARSASEIILDITENETSCFYYSCLIICGSGNNGGDGFALARHLVELFYLQVYWIGSEEKMSSETKMNFNAVRKLGIPMTHISDEEEIDKLNFDFDIVVDSMIGVGGSEKIRGKAGKILEKLDRIDTLKIAVDAPTGLNTETGAVFDYCFAADHTITMFAVKSGMLLGEAPDFCGRIHTAYLGAPEGIIESTAKISILEEFDLQFLMPARYRMSSKFDYGRVIILAGSKKYPGAAALCANAAIKSGAGLVQLYTTYMHPSLLPEVIPNILPETEEGFISEKAVDTVLDACKKADSLVIGPGLGDAPETTRLVKTLIENIPEDLPVLIDADGLRAFNSDTRLRKNILLTPHSGELSRTTGTERYKIEENPLLAAREWANILNCCIMLKTIPVVISDGEDSVFNLNGNAGMASGGSGDVLSGIIGALAAQDMDIFEAGALGAYLHAKAGDLYIEDFPMHTLTASNLLDYLEAAFKID